MKKLLSMLLFLPLLFPAAVSGDMFPAIPETFWAFGPSLGYTWSDNLSGWTVGFEALKAYAVFTCAAGAKYIFSDDDKPDFSGNNGLLSIYMEGTIALPFPLGIGISYNFALGSGSGPGLQLYYGVPIPIGKKYYLSLFWRPSWIWINGNAETTHEIGIYWKRSSYYQRQQEASRRRYQWRMHYERERRKAATNKRPGNVQSATNR